MKYTVEYFVGRTDNTWFTHEQVVNHPYDVSLEDADDLAAAFLRYFDLKGQFVMVSIYHVREYEEKTIKVGLDYTVVFTVEVPVDVKDTVQAYRDAYGTKDYEPTDYAEWLFHRGDFGNAAERGRLIAAHLWEHDAVNIECNTSWEEG